VAKQNDTYYDLEFDKDAIEASFAMQYGIRLSKEDLPLGEFLRLLSGIMPDTPLGRLVILRSEKRSEVLKGLSVMERKLRADWFEFCNTKKRQGCRANESCRYEELQKELMAMFG